MKWTVPPIWEGDDVWILGGGPSVTKQFGIPDDIVNKVRTGESPPSVYSPYMKPIHDCHVIGINVSYLIGDWIDMMFFGDAKFYLRYKQSLAKWPGLKVSCSPSTENVPWIKYLMRDPSRPQGISQRKNCVSWNQNSGASAISLAAHLGAKRIILLGFDMNVDPTGKKHWHNLYKSATPPPARGNIPPKRHKGRVIAKIPPFSKHLRGFPEIARNAKAMGIEILNASPDSAITVFPKFSLKELLFDNS
jgi:hypothetical protein